MFKKLFGFGKKKEEEEEIKDQVTEETESDEGDPSDDEIIEIDRTVGDDSVEDDPISYETDDQINDESIYDEINYENEESEDITVTPSENADVIPEIIIEEIDEEVFEDSLVDEVVEEPATESADVYVETSQFVEENVETEEEIVVVETHIAEETPAEEPKKKVSFFEKLKSGLTKTSKVITDRIDNLLNDYGKIDDELFDELEEILITADIGMNTTMEIIDELKDELKARKITDSSEVKGVLHDVLVRIMAENNNSELISSTPAIILVIGVNGAGKTTTIGKIANQFKKKGNSVMLAAGDTFRAAAIDQLQVWGERAGVPVISQQEGSDPAAVIFDAIQAAKSRKVDVLICDTAGRLHNKVNLMNELAKVFKVVEREYPDADKEVLLVLDATTGQNAISQAKTFREAANISGIVLTKLDGTAKGGVILGINSELNIPVKLIGVGEGVDDLQKFDPVSFVDALLNTEHAE